MNRTRAWVVGSAVLLLAATFLSINSTAIKATSAQRRRTTGTNAAMVADLFRTNCARCHGVDGRGDTSLGQTYNAPDFTDVQWWRRQGSVVTTRALVSIVIHGKRDMPAFGKKLTGTQIKLLVDHVERFRKAKNHSPWRSSCGDKP